MAIQPVFGNADLEVALGAFLSQYPGRAARTAAIRLALESPAAGLLRRQLGEWIIRLVPLESLVPDLHRPWRPVVRDAMLFVVSHLSAARLAPKIVEQLELAPETTAETRLLRLISRVPGLQKIGQVLARNRRLPRPLRNALAELENGISDVGIEEIRQIILAQLGPRIEAYSVEIGTAIFSEASVSAVVRFTWRNPATRRRERGVLKVLKPYIPDCYAEDMKILERLAGFLARKYRSGGSRFGGLADTLTEIRLLLEREVDYRREQATLADISRVYRGTPGVRIPRLIEPLCCGTITALSHERGVKVTEAFGRSGRSSARVAERLAEALIAVPALSRRDEAVYHADPHAGNLLYDKRRGELVILDWALAERLTREQRKNVLLLVLMMILRDRQRICESIEHLLQGRANDRGAQRRITIRKHVDQWLAGLPLYELPGAMDAMELLDEIALDGVRFPAALLMFRKATFTLDAVLEDIAGFGIRMDTAVARYALAHWPATAAALYTLLSPRDWLALEWSALLFAARLIGSVVLRPWQWMPGLPELGSAAATR